MGQAAEVYAEQLSSLSLGHPLWFPESSESAGEPQIGDVGYVSNGRFWRLFNVTVPRDHPWNASGLPEDYTPFIIPERQHHREDKYLSPNLLHSHSLQATRISSQVIIAGSPLAQTNISYKFECSNEHGAFLALNNKAERQGIDRSRLFERYIARNHRSWYYCAKEQIGLSCKPEELVCVSGWVKTSEWMVAAFLKNERSHTCSIQGQTGSFAGVGCEVTITKSDSMSAIYHSGPQTLAEHTPSSLATGAQEDDRSISSPLTSGGQINDQTIFIEFYKVKYRLRIPKVLKAAMGPSALPPSDEHPGNSTPTPSLDTDSDGSVELEMVSPAGTSAKTPLDHVLDYLLEAVPDADLAITSHVHLNDLLASRDNIAFDTEPQRLERLRVQVGQDLVQDLRRSPPQMHLQSIDNFNLVALLIDPRDVPFAPSKGEFCLSGGLNTISSTVLPSNSLNDLSNVLPRPDMEGSPEGEAVWPGKKAAWGDRIPPESLISRPLESQKPLTPELNAEQRPYALGHNVWWNEFEGVVEADEDSVSTNESSNDSSYYGTEALTGIWTQYIGDHRGAEKMSTATKLRNIEHELKHEDPSRWKRQTMEMLLDFQKVYFVYPDSVRRRVWDLIFFAMDMKGWSSLATTIGSWDHRYDMEKRWFIQQLAICKLSGWSSHPVRKKILRPLGPIFKTPKDVSSSQPSALSDSFFRILLYFMDKDAPMIHETFHLDSFSRLLANRDSQKIGIHVALSLFFDNFASAHPFPNIPSHDSLFSKLPSILNTYPAANCLVQYLCTAGLEEREANMAAVVGHIVDSIAPFATENQQQEAIVRRRHPYLNSSLVVNPTWPFMCFAVLLTWQSADATRMLVDVGIIGILDGLAHRYKKEKNMCYLMIALLNTMAVHHDLSKCRLKLNLEGWSSGQPRRRSSAARVAHRPASSGGPANPLTASPRPMTQELLPEPPQSSGSLSISESESLPRDPDSTYRRFMLADALALAQRAVSLDKRKEVERAVVAYAASAELLVEFMRLKVQNGRVSHSAKLVRGIYDIYMARVDVLCRSRAITAPPISRPPHIPTTSNSMLPHQERAGSVGVPIPPEVARSSQFMETLQQTNDRLFEVWRSDMIPRPQ